MSADTSECAHSTPHTPMRLEHAHESQVKRAAGLPAHTKLMEARKKVEDISETGKKKLNVAIQKCALWRGAHMHTNEKSTCIQGFRFAKPLSPPSSLLSSLPTTERCSRNVPFLTACAITQAFLASEPPRAALTTAAAHAHAACNRCFCITVDLVRNTNATLHTQRRLRGKRKMDATRRKSASMQPRQHT